MRNRWFDTTLMRWISRDPAGYVDSRNLYALGWGNPVGVTDPLGLYAYPPFAAGAEIEDGGGYIGYDPSTYRGMDWFDKISNFFAGYADSMTFGGTYYLRGFFGWNATIRTDSGWYIAGEITQIVIETIVTGGGAVLRHGARKVSSQAVRSAAEKFVGPMRMKGMRVHHNNTLFGHLGRNRPALFPTAGLPAWIHSGRWNLRLVDHARHVRIHRRLWHLERWWWRFFNWYTLPARIVRDIVWNGISSSGGQSATGVPTASSSTGGAPAGSRIRSSL